MALVDNERVGLVAELRSIGSVAVSEKEFEAAKNMVLDVAKRIREERKEKQSNSGTAFVVEASSSASASALNSSPTPSADWGTGTKMTYVFVCAWGVSQTLETM